MRIKKLVVTLLVLLAVSASERLTAQTRYIRYSHAGRVSFGILDGTTVRELTGSVFASPAPRRTGRTFRLADVRLLTPVDPSRTGKVLGVAINTRRPSRDQAVIHPRWFAKLPTSLVATEGEVEHPPEANNLDWEGELVLVIGRRTRHVTVEDAPRYIFGVTVGNDFSENTWYGERQGANEPSRLISKAMDTWAGLGPAIVTGVDYSDLKVDIRVNGDLVATGRTSQLLNSPAQLVSYLSRYMTLLPGDLIYTGTYPTLPGKTNVVRPGDTVEVEIEKLGTLRNRIVAMQSPLPAPPVATAPRPDAASATSPAAAPVSGAVAGGVPQFQVDPFWPKELPNNWIVGQVSGVAVDDRDHVWLLHRPRTLTAREAGAVQQPPLSECCVPAPPVLEFDPDGNVVGAWGGPGQGYDWPESEHTIYVDPQGFVWIASNGLNDGMVLKFTRDGKFVLQIGKHALSNGNSDVTSLGQPAGIFVDAAANEVYIADGYKNRRVIVFDATTGAYKRHWGAYGRAPSDSNPGRYDPAAPLDQQFRTPVHAVRIANDGLVYVADRVNNRIQVFRKNGSFVREGIIAKQTLAMGSVWDIAFSRDSAQTYLFVPDGTNQKVWILRRDDLSVAGSFGRGGRMAGQFGWVHNVAVDSRGNLYLTEVDIYKRIQKFTPRGGAPAPVR